MSQATLRKHFKFRKYLGWLSLALALIFFVESMRQGFGSNLIQTILTGENHLGGHLAAIGLFLFFLSVVCIGLNFAIRKFHNIWAFLVSMIILFYLSYKFVELLVPKYAKILFGIDI